MKASKCIELLSKVIGEKGDMEVLVEIGQKIGCHLMPIEYIKIEDEYNYCWIRIN
jgi:hypothetical protein